VERFDHHCHVVGNCIGRGNQRSFTLYLLAMLSAQLLYIYLVPTVLMQQCLNTGGVCLHTTPGAVDFLGANPATAAPDQDTALALASNGLATGSSSRSSSSSHGLEAGSGTDAVRSSSSVTGKGRSSSAAWLLLSSLWYGSLDKPGWLLLLLFHVSVNLFVYSRPCHGSMHVY
jgi:hypothetical protein